MSLNRTAMDATLAINKAAMFAGATLEQRIAAVRILQRHVDGQLNKLMGERAPESPVSQAEGS